MNSDILICPHCGQTFKARRYAPEINGQEITTKVEIVNFANCPKCERIVRKSNQHDLPERLFR